MTISSQFFLTPLITFEIKEKIIEIEKKNFNKSSVLLWTINSIKFKTLLYSSEWHYFIYLIQSMKSVQSPVTVAYVVILQMGGWTLWIVDQDQSPMEEEKKIQHQY